MRRGIKLTNLPFYVKAVVTALKQVPIINASLDDEAGEIVLHDQYHIGIATATAKGLVVPVIRDADRKDWLRLPAKSSNSFARLKERHDFPLRIAGRHFHDLVDREYWWARYRHRSFIIRKSGSWPLARYSNVPPTTMRVIWYRLESPICRSPSTIAWWMEAWVHSLATP